MWHLSPVKGTTLVLWLFCAILLVSALSKADLSPIGERESPLTEHFDSLVYKNLDYWHVPGISIAVVDGNETFSKGYGIASFPAQNVTPSTLFYTGSTTKAFTAAALALLISDSENTTNPLTWRSPVSSLIRDDFVLPEEYATFHVTLEDAASHRTGMPRHDFSYGGPNFTLRDVVRSLRLLPMTQEMRTTWQYNNMMYMTLSHVIQTLTGKWLGDVLWQRIWKPLDMTRTYFSLAHAEAAVENGEAELATGYLWDNVTQEYEALAHLDFPVISGAGNVISNVLDYAKWLHCLIDKAEPLSEKDHEELRTPRINAPMEEYPTFTGTQNYALGWHRSNYRGEPLILHPGGLPGFAALIGYLPKRKFGFAIMGNTVGTATFVAHTMAFHLLDNLLGVPDDERFDFATTAEGQIEKLTERLRHPKEYLFPKAPNGTDAVPLSRPLEAYTGVYFNPGYRNVTLTLTSTPPTLDPQQSVLGTASSMAKRHLTSKVDHSWYLQLRFEHISGEVFAVRVWFDEGPGPMDLNNPLEVQVTKAEFRIGEDGKVSEMGAALEPRMGEAKIWFRKLE